MPAFDPLTYRYASRRNVVYAQNAVACTFVLLGAQIGLDVMKSGGSAVDAAVAMGRGHAVGSSRPATALARTALRSFGSSGTNGSTASTPAVSRRWR